MQVEREARYLYWVESGERVSNTLVTCPEEGDNRGKPRLIPRMSGLLESLDQSFGALGGACGLSACWGGNGLPRLRRLGGVRARPPTMELRHGPYSYGRQQ